MDIYTIFVLYPNIPIHQMSDYASVLPCWPSTLHNRTQLRLDQSKFLAKNQRTQNKPITPIPGPADHEPAFEIGTEKPIVWLRQLSNVVSIPVGRGASRVFVSLLSVAVLLYPSKVSTALLAR